MDEQTSDDISKTEFTRQDCMNVIEKDIEEPMDVQEELQETPQQIEEDLSLQSPAEPNNTGTTEIETDKFEEQLEVSDKFGELQVSDKLDKLPEVSDKLEEQLEVSDKLEEQQISDKLEEQPEGSDKLEEQPDISDKLEEQPEVSDKLEEQPEVFDKLEKQQQISDKLVGQDYDKLEELLQQSDKIVEGVSNKINELMQTSDDNNALNVTDRLDLNETEETNLNCDTTTDLTNACIEEKSKDLTDDENQAEITQEQNSSELMETNHEKDDQSESMLNTIQNPLFVNSDSNVNDVQTSTDAEMEIDPIASPDIPDIMEPEIILADEDEEIVTCTSDVSEEKYIITKCNLPEEKTCMICLKVEKPSYAFTNKVDVFICSENCFDKFKKDNEGKYVMAGIRVKTFDMVTATDFSNELNEKCKSCNNIAGSSAISLASITFCDVACLKKFYRTNCDQCIVCKTDIREELIGKYWLRFGLKFKAFCNYDCYTSYKSTKTCSYCRAELTSDNETEYCDDLCSASYMKVERIKECSVCHQDKNAAIEFVNDVHSHYFCGEPCFVAYKFVNKTDMKECEICHRYVVENTMLANSILNQLCTMYICSEKCRSVYILMNSNKVKCQICETKKDNFNCIKKKNNYYCSLYCYEKLYVMQKKCTNCDLLSQIVIKEDNLNFCSFYCYNNYKIFECDTDNLPNKSYQLLNAHYHNYNENGTVVKIPIQQMVYIKPPELVKQRNIATMVRPNQVAKGITCKPKDTTKAIQTEQEQINKLVIPIPVPIYVPMPVHMYVDYFPMPFPVPIPIPVPIFIPTTRNSIKGIFKEMNKIKNKVPADPLEAELLMMAEMVAEDKKDESNSSDEDEAETFNEPAPNFGDDVLQMALKMADDFEEPVDLEGEVSVSTIRQSTLNVQPGTSQSFEPVVRKRGRPKSLKRNRAETSATATVVVNQSSVSTQKPDANLCLKYTFGVNAWKQWVTTKNNELEKSSKRPKLFKPELLQLTADELNYSLCLFVKEVRKPNGTEYAPDTIYYLCLGIQQYLYENNRIDNIFCDAFYEKFTDCLNDVCKKFSLLYNESQYIVTRVEEEHLWESKQLGAHSPLVLLNTLMFFNTKHFSLTTVDEHLQLSFSHIMKHWKRNPNQPGARNVLLRFYPPQSFQMENKKKKMYEQQENEDNPIRCPVKLYEFYLSKCPESVKTRNDVFYLLPERSCVPDSPLWYSTMALDENSLDKMLNRVKMVKEINIALLST